MPYFTENASLQNGIFSSLPYLGAILSGAIAGPTADYLRRHNYMTSTNVRKLFNNIGEDISLLQRLLRRFRELNFRVE